MSGFKAFLLRGNLVELAVAFVMGATFAALVAAFVADIITPIIAAIGGQHNFSSLSFSINSAKFLYGSFINALVTFLVVGAVLYFLVVIPYNRFRNRFMPEPEPAPTRSCPFCTSSVAVAATRCPFCTSELTAGS